MTTDVKLYSLSYRELKSYMFATLFVVGNIVLPQLCHLVPQGGLTWLPIYFFTLIAAYKYGWKVGLLTAVASPIINSVFFGMPALATLPIILIKSVLLATAAGMAAQYFNRFNILTVAAVVVSYQVVGTLIEWAMVGTFYQAIQDVRIGMPGILFQIIGGYLFIKYVVKN